MKDYLNIKIQPIIETLQLCKIPDSIYFNK